jgi:23S rRNA pseudouridine2605 synthase
MSTDNPTLENEKNSEMRLNRYCARCGLGSRRSCDEIIAAGRVFVNGRRIFELGTKINAETDVVEYGGKRLLPARPFTYMAYNKPRGVIVTKFDPEGRGTIYDALDRLGIPARDLNYVGRLDADSEGLLLLTNDGDLIHALTHPRYHIKKVYEVCIDRRIVPSDVRTMVGDGIESEGQTLRAGAVREMHVRTNEGEWYEVDLYEGKKRQIRRIFETLGYTVKRLRRTQFASVKLGELEMGAQRTLTEREIAALKSAGFPTH